MDAKHMKTMSVRMIYVMAILALALAAGSASAQGISPWLRAHPEWESVDGWSWWRELPQSDKDGAP